MLIPTLPAPQVSGGVQGSITVGSAFSGVKLDANDGDLLQALMPDDIHAAALSQSKVATSGTSSKPFANATASWRVRLDSWVSHASYQLLLTHSQYTASQLPVTLLIGLHPSEALNASAASGSGTNPPVSGSQGPEATQAGAEQRPVLPQASDWSFPRPNPYPSSLGMLYSAVMGNTVQFAGGSISHILVRNNASALVSQISLSPLSSNMEVTLPQQLFVALVTADGQYSQFWVNVSSKVKVCWCVVCLHCTMYAGS